MGHGKVKTFDNLEYDYQLNDCEHVVFKDCSESSRVEVSVQQKSSRKTVKVTIDNHQYELKVPTSSGSQETSKQDRQEQESRQVEREQTEFAEQKKNFYQ